MREAVVRMCPEWSSAIVQNLLPREVGDRHAEVLASGRYEVLLEKIAQSSLTVWYTYTSDWLIFRSNIMRTRSC